MNNLKINKQKSSDQFWKDESGVQIPYNRTTKTERLKETTSYSLATKAIKHHQALAKFKEEMREQCENVYIKFLEENDQDASDHKGNIVWYNFDRSIKIQVKVNERIDFDDMGIEAAKAQLREFLDNNVESQDQIVKEMVLDAFETSRGKLDVKKVLGLVRYKSKVKNPNFQKAISLIEDAIRRPESKTYYMLWVKDEKGEYQYIDLNFSSVK